MTGQDIIDFIKANHLEEAKATVTATKYHDGDHDCYTTDQISLIEGSDYVDGKSVPTIDFYVDDELY